MKSLINNFNKLSRDQRWYLALMSGGVAMLMVAALFISTGGMMRVTNVLAQAGILPESLTGCVFHCNNTSYSLVALTPTVNGAAVTTVAPGQNVVWVWNAGTYGGGNFSYSCEGGYLGSNYVCNIQLGASPTFDVNACAPSTQ